MMYDKGTQLLESPCGLYQSFRISAPVPGTGYLTWHTCTRHPSVMSVYTDIPGDQHYYTTPPHFQKLPPITKILSKKNYLGAFDSISAVNIQINLVSYAEMLQVYRSFCGLAWPGKAVMGV